MIRTEVVRGGSMKTVGLLWHEFAATYSGDRTESSSYVIC